MNWKDASVDRVICDCTGVKKKDIILAIVAGARTLTAIHQKTGACSEDCLIHGGRCSCGNHCVEDIQQMLAFYSNIVDQLQRRSV